ncbi:MAG: hypothetical protein HY278_02045 [candidate division NC10 bacterium]|nr:hypothetical protein [candidate division NC10 bacterium]
MRSVESPTGSSRQDGRLAVALDYSVLDHLQRVQDGTYNGTRAEALRRIRAAGEGQRIDVWIAEITPVEMLHGIEKVATDDAKRARAAARDTEKEAIAAAMYARILGYPCSKLDDTYSRLGMSFRLAGPDTHLAEALERRLLSIKGVSAGDARQLVSCAFPFDGVQIDFHPRLDCFVAEDVDLIRALIAEVAAENLPELRHLTFGTSEEIVAKYPWTF